MSETNQETQVEIIGTNVVYQQDKAQIDVQIATAKAYPRNIKRCVDNAIAIVTMDQETAQSCSYSVPRGGKPVTGPSVHLAKILAQMWKNLRIEARVVDVDAKHVTSEAVCFDLENNIAIKTQVKRSIIGRTGRFNDDMITVTGNAANSIALRNAILAIIPKSVTDTVYNSAKKFITGDLTDKVKLIAKRKQVFDGFTQTYPEVKEKDILSVIGKAAIDHVTADDLVVLIGIAQAIKDGDTTVEMAFKPQASTATSQEKLDERLLLMIADAKDEEAMEKLRPSIKGANEKIVKAFIDKIEKLTNK
jgi:hypothetical protein